MVLLIVVRLAVTRKLDRPFAIGSVAMMVAFVVAEMLSRTDLWRPIAAAMTKS
jgi:hypothetical protein